MSDVNAKSPQHIYDDDITCVICVNVYRDPRLLPCGHTYCLECLENWHNVSGRKHIFLCPVCRKTTWLPQIGIRGFSCNYFVPTRSSRPHYNKCQISENILPECKFCNEKLCQSCLASHDICDANNSNPDGNCDDVLQHNDNVREIFSVMRQVTRTCCPADSIARFSCDGLTAKRCVNKIVPVSENEAWILCDGEPIVSKYDISGRVTERRRAPGKTIDIAVHPDGPLLAIEKSGNSVLVCGDVNSALVEFVHLDTYYPTCLLIRQDGSLIVSVKSSPIHYTVECCLMFFNPDRQLIVAHKLVTTGLSLTISAMAVDCTTDRICIIDRETDTVHVLVDNKHTLQYRRSTAFPGNPTQSAAMMPSNFRPLSITSGLNGSFLLLDGGSGFIHILNTEAKLTGVVVMDDAESEERLNTISVGHDGKLWVGDKTDGKIKVYNLDTFANFLGPGFDIPVERESAYFMSDCGLESNPMINFGLYKYVPGEVFRHIAFVSQHRYIAVRNGPSGPEFILEDTGSKEQNRFVAERALHNIRENGVTRTQLRDINIHVDEVTLRNFIFEKIPYLMRNGQLYPSGNSEHDEELVNFMCRIHPHLTLSRNGRK